jgi:6-phosphogluconolactonase (cycloisomerase 2 family)
VINESGTFYQPGCGAGDAATHVITITPKGSFLYSSNNDATVGAYKINADGSLAHIADLNLGPVSPEPSLAMTVSYGLPTPAAAAGRGTFGRSRQAPQAL